MNLDDSAAFLEIDSQDMRSHIDGLPEQLQKAWELGLSQPLPGMGDIRQVLIAGMGGSAIGADLLAAYAAPRCSVPVFVNRDYDLPAWARDSGTLVIASSHSGNTEETLFAFEAARARGCSTLAIATGGQLAEMASSAGVPLWSFEHRGQPRAAVGFSFGLILAAFFRLNLLPDPGVELAGAVRAMREQQGELAAEVPAARNPAKRYAGQMFGRWVTVVGSGVLGPVARRWKGQVNELAKAWSQFEFLPEADHNTLAGILNTEELFSRLIVIFLRSPGDHPRNRLRSDLTRKTFMLEGLNTDFVDARGDSPMAHLWTCLHFGDYTAYYLAMAYGVDPTPVASIEMLKQDLQSMG